MLCLFSLTLSTAGVGGGEEEREDMYPVWGEGHPWPTLYTSVYVYGVIGGGAPMWPWGQTRGGARGEGAVISCSWCSCH